MAKGSSGTTETPQFMINNTDMQLKRDVVNITKRMGVPYSQALRDVIRKWRDSQPPEMRRPMVD